MGYNLKKVQIKEAELKSMFFEKKNSNRPVLKGPTEHSLSATTLTSSTHIILLCYFPIFNHSDYLARVRLENIRPLIFSVFPQLLQVYRYAEPLKLEKNFWPHRKCESHFCLNILYNII